MQLFELPAPNLEARANQYTERSPGLHLSHITGDMLATMNPAKFGDKDGGPNWVMLMMGLAFERVLEMAWLDREFEYRRSELVRPGEIELDGIIGTPDAFDTAIGCPEEYKCTKLSLKHDIRGPKMAKYWWQLKAYAKMLGADSGTLWVLFINGNYSYNPNDPASNYQVRGWHAVFTQLELDENWNMITSHARRRGWLP